jgi:hypothetical protein
MRHLPVIEIMIILVRTQLSPTQTLGSGSSLQILDSTTCCCKWYLRGFYRPFHVNKNPHISLNFSVVYWITTVYIVAYSLKAKTVESQQPTVTKQRPVNNNKWMVFSAQFVLMDVHSIIEYVMPSLSNNFTVTEERCFLRGPCWDVISRTS